MNKSLAAMLAKVGPEWGPVPVKRVPSKKLTQLCDMGLIEVRMVPAPHQCGYFRVESRLKPEANNAAV